MVENHKSECEEQESKKRILYLNKIRLESVIEQLQNSQEYNKIEQIVKQQVNKAFGDDQQLLKLAFESIIESLLKDPFRLQSFFEYAMSVASTSTAPSFVNDETTTGKPRIYNEHYMSPDYEADSKQVEHIKNIILHESEKLYNKKIEKFTNSTISEAAVYDNNQMPLTCDEKQTLKRLLLLRFIESQ